MSKSTEKNTVTGHPNAEQLQKINRLTRREMQPEELYVFSAVLCDNQIDRDGERFSQGCLKELAELYVGVTGVLDHQAKSSAQTARIFATEVVQQGDASSNVPEPYTALKAHIYMVRSDASRDMILEIDGGIKKEISVGCVVRNSVCSVCGARADRHCGHIRGQSYEGSSVPCHTVHESGVDAYEWSFVAVPAQPRAGVVKRFGGYGAQDISSEPEEIIKSLGSLGAVDGAQLKAALDKIAVLRERAQMGEQYHERLCSEYVRLCRLASPEISGETALAMARAMSSSQLRKCSDDLLRAARSKMPLHSQLALFGDSGQERQKNSEFKL